MSDHKIQLYCLTHDNNDLKELNGGYSCRGLVQYLQYHADDTNRMDFNKIVCNLQMTLWKLEKFD